MSQNSHSTSFSTHTNGAAIKNVNLERQNSGKVLLITAATGLGINYAPHFGMYQILNYLRHNKISADIYDRDLELFKRATIYENNVMESLKKGEYDVVGISVAQDRWHGEQKMITDLVNEINKYLLNIKFTKLKLI